VAPVIADRPEWVYADDAKVVTLMRALLAKRSGSMVAAMVGQLALHHNKGLPKDTTVVGLFQVTLRHECAYVSRSSSISQFRKT